MLSYETGLSRPLLSPWNLAFIPPSSLPPAVRWRWPLLNGLVVDGALGRGDSGGDGGMTTQHLYVNKCLPTYFRAHALTSAKVSETNNGGHRRLVTGR